MISCFWVVLNMSYAAGVLLLIAACAIVIGAVLQVLQYRRGRHIITRVQLVWRLTTAVLLVIIIALIFLGVVYPWPDPVAELIFWSGLVLLGIIVIFLAMYDLRLVQRQRHIRQAELYRAMQDLQDLTARDKKGKDKKKKDET